MRFDVDARRNDFVAKERYFSGCLTDDEKSFDSVVPVT
jgi:hypothetical protein